MMGNGPAARFWRLQRAPARNALAILRKPPKNYRCLAFALKCRLSRNQLACNTRRGRLRYAAGTGMAPPGPGVPHGWALGRFQSSSTAGRLWSPFDFFFSHSDACQNFVYNTSMAVHELIYGPVGTNSPLRSSPAKNFVEFIVRPGNWDGHTWDGHAWDGHWDQHTLGLTHTGMGSTHWDGIHTLTGIDTLGSTHWDRHTGIDALGIDTLGWTHWD